MKKSLGIILSAVFAVLFVLQAATGNMDLSFFAFPVNVVSLLALAGLTYVAVREWGSAKAVRAFASSAASVVLIVAFLLCSLVIAFFPELGFQHSWIFNGVLMSLLSNLLAVLMNYRGRFRLRFYLTHTGIFVFVAALTFGAPDMEKSRAVLHEGETVEYAYDGGGRLVPIGGALRLDEFEVEYYDNGVPRIFRAEVSSRGERHEITVNHPWRRSWKENVYLVSHGTEADTRQPYCVLEFVVQPWKYLALSGLVLTAAGAFLLLWGRKKNRR